MQDLQKLQCKALKYVYKDFTSSYTNLQKGAISVHCCRGAKQGGGGGLGGLNPP